MTPNEVAANLQHFNDWRRGHHDEQPDPCVIGEAIDAAVEMIERLEEAESDALEQARLNGMGSEREAALMAKLEAAEKSDAESIGMYRKARDERDALRAELSKQQALTDAAQHIAEVAQSRANQLQAKIESMEQQEPVGKIVAFGESLHEPSWNKGKLPPLGTDLYALSGAKPAPSFADAYQGAMEEVAIWKKRALEAEEINRKFIAEINGPTYMGEPAQPAPSVPENKK